MPKCLGSEVSVHPTDHSVHCLSFSFTLSTIRQSVYSVIPWNCHQRHFKKTFVLKQAYISNHRMPLFLTAGAACRNFICHQQGIALVWTLGLSVSPEAHLPDKKHSVGSHDNNNNNNNNLDDIYSSGSSGPKSASARWPPTRRPSCKLDL